MYNEFYRYYDIIYRYKKYNQESDFINKVIKKFLHKKKVSILDVACGTGNHLNHLRKYGHELVGLDISRKMLSIAKRKNKGVKFFKRDMRRFNLKRKFDVVLCLFSSVLFCKDKNELIKTLKNFNKHLNKGGLLIFDAPAKEKVNRIAAGTSFIDKNKILIWYNVPHKNFAEHYIKLLINGKKARIVEERYKTGIFRVSDFKSALKIAGVKNIKTYSSFMFRKWQPCKRAVFVAMKV